MKASRGRHLMVADDAEAMAAAVIRLLCDAEERQRLARAGREHVVQTYSWGGAMRQMDALLAPVLEYKRKSGITISPQ